MKENDSLISVIVPVYNVKLYLERCLECLRNQTYKNLEIILVDDGSTDGSGLICDRWAHIDSRFKVIHQPNKGVSAARNTGIRNCNGEYITFVDSDDIVTENMCQILYSCAKANKADLVIGHYIYSEYKSISTNISVASNKNTSCTVLNQRSTLDKITDLKFKEGINVVAKLFKTSTAKKHLFKEGYALGEDQEYIFEIIKYCETICVSNAIVYYYVKREQSATLTKPSTENQEKLREIYNQIIKKEYYPIEFKNRLICFRISQCEMTIINSMVYYNDIDKEILTKCKDYIKKYCKDILNARFPIWKKIQILIAGYSPLLYINIMKVYRKLIR